MTKIQPPPLKPCPQCHSLECGVVRCRFSGLTHHDWRAGAKPVLLEDATWEPQPPQGWPEEEDEL